AKSEPVKTEPAKSEPAKSEPTKPVAVSNPNSNPNPNQNPSPNPPANPATPPPADANLAIASTPPGAAIYVAAEPQGVTPAALKASPGSHRIVVLLEGHRMKREQVRVAGAHTQANFTLEAINTPGSAGLKVRCAKTHGELRILVDGEDTGRAC